MMETAETSQQENPGLGKKQGVGDWKEAVEQMSDASRAPEGRVKAGLILRSGRARVRNKDSQAPP